MSSRPSRAKRPPPALDEPTRLGLEALVAGNEASLNAMLDRSGDDAAALLTALQEVMALNALSPEQLLARFFDRTLLAAECTELGCSAKGSEATLAARLAARWLKKPKKQKKNKDEDDWRWPMFFWRGTLKSSVHGKIRWEGAWVSSTSLPSDAAFAESSSTFELESDANSIPLDSADTLGSLGETSFRGSYLLDNGGGMQSFSDVEHVLVFDGECVAARGTTEFGAFVSLGRCVTTEDGLVMTLARRYITDSDPRRSLSATELVEGLKTESQKAKPWESLPYKGA